MIGPCCLRPKQRRSASSLKTSVSPSRRKSPRVKKRTRLLAKENWMARRSRKSLSLKMRSMMLRRIKRSSCQERMKT